MSAPRNTAATPPEILLLGAMASGSSGFIEGMEAQGQREMVASTTLPTDLHSKREDFEALGFKFGKPVEGDEMFTECELPEGWQREGSDHAMWSYITDAEGYRRVSIFYKAAFYDRSAHAGIVAIPRTSAQADAWEAADPPDRDKKWMAAGDRREGPNYVYGFRGRYGDDAPEGKHAYNDDGRRMEVEVAPDGSIVDRREFTTEPTE